MSIQVWSKEPLLRIEQERDVQKYESSCPQGAGWFTVGGSGGILRQADSRGEETVAVVHRDQSLLSEGKG